jgi:hypothetical protein
MMTKPSFLIFLALTTVACGDKDPESGDTGSNDDTSNQQDDDTGDDDSGDGDTGGDDDDTGDDDTGDDDTGDDDTGDDGTEEPQRPPTPDAFQRLSSDARDAHTQNYDVNTSDWNTIDGEQGSTLFFEPSSFLRSDGTLAEGDVQVELIEIFDKGSMLVNDMPTTGKQADGQHAQLISGGEHYIAASQDGEELRLNGTFQLTAPTELTGGPDTAMNFFRAEVEEGVPAGKDDRGVWVEEGLREDAFGIGDGGGTDGADTAYWVISDQFGWSNIDRWYTDPRPKTTIHVDVPDGWDDTNAAVYLSYDGEPTALARMDTYDDATGLFSEHYGMIPIGLEVHLIFVTESEGDWSYAVQGTTIVDGHLTAFDSPDDFIETTTDGLVTVINALP